jgi:hypothetical protein
MTSDGLIPIQGALDLSIWAVAPRARQVIDWRWLSSGLLRCVIALMMKAASASETSVNFYQTTRRNNAEDSHLHTLRRENLKPHKVLDCVPFPCASLSLDCSRDTNLRQLTVGAYDLQQITNRRSKVLKCIWNSDWFRLLQYMVALLFGKQERLCVSHWMSHDISMVESNQIRLRIPINIPPFPWDVQQCSQLPPHKFLFTHK